MQGFDAGADDYVAKPFHLEEVLARLRALLRRFGRHAKSESSVPREGRYGTGRSGQGHRLSDSKIRCRY